MLAAALALAVPLGAAAAYPANDSARCKVGLTLGGLGAALDGDYMAGGAGEYFAPARTDKGMLYLAFSWTDPNHTQHTPYGCDLYGCSAADRARASGRWGIISQTAGSSRYSLLAVCDAGCPDWKPSCADVFNQPPTESALHCPTWPRNWTRSSRWSLLNASAGGGERSVAASSYCCARKANPCDRCGADTCSGLTGLLRDHCPPKPPSPRHPLTPLQRACCEHVSNPVLPFNGCSCKRPASITRCR
eukprot:COSAG04_NODE_7391_length_1136_cov_0.945998_1_plen_247_part_00